MGGMPIDSGFITFLILVIGAIAAAWWRVERVVRSLKKDLQEETKASVNNIQAQMNAATALTQLTMAQLGEFRVHVAENFVRRDGINDLRNQVMTAIGEVKT